MKLARIILFADINAERGKKREKIRNEKRFLKSICVSTILFDIDIQYGILFYFIIDFKL